jgi:hypothetical protein
MRISPRKLDALPALTGLAQPSAGIVKSEPVIAERNLCKKVLPATLLEPVPLRIVDGVRSANGGCPSKAWPQQTSPGPVISGIDDPPAPFDDQASLCGLVSTDWKHRALVRILLDVRTGSANTLDQTPPSDLCCCRRN